MPIDFPVTSFVKSLPASADTIIITVNSDKKLDKHASGIDKSFDGIISHHIKTNTKFKADIGQTLSITLPEKFAPHLRVILLGIGDVKDGREFELETAGGKLNECLTRNGSKKAVIANGDAVSSAKIAAIILGMRLATYRFDGYKTVKKKDKENEVSLTSFSVVNTDKDTAKLVTDIKEQSESIALVRDLVNEPPNKLYPASFADRIKKTLTPLGVKVTVMDEKTLAKQGMGCLIAVGQASEFPPRLVIMEWNGAKATKGKKKSQPIAFVGKGITFDSGGLNVKPYEGMMDMKMDMAGAATVVGLMHLLATQKCNKNVVAVVALAENSISDEATRPSDIVTSYSGKTVEILNTDAEGRLILADALTYVQQKHDPQFVVNLATLTGAIMISLGLEYCGAFVNNDNLWTQINQASAETGEKIWRMPLDKSFRKEMDSVFADIKNIGNGRYGGSCTAAAFLSEFIDENRPWAHLDIAGVAMSKTTPTCPVPFASGYGIKLLNKFVEGYKA